MKKVDFSKIELEMIDGTMREADFQHGENGLPNQVYMQAREIKWKELGCEDVSCQGRSGTDRRGSEVYPRLHSSDSLEHCCNRGN